MLDAAVKDELNRLAQSGETDHDRLYNLDTVIKITGFTSQQIKRLVETHWFDEDLKRGGAVNAATQIKALDLIILLNNMGLGSLPLTKCSPYQDLVTDYWQAVVTEANKKLV